MTSTIEDNRFVFMNFSLELRYAPQGEQRPSAYLADSFYKLLQVATAGYTRSA
jgi:hypothetical protein